MGHDYREFGFEVVKYLDNVFLYGTGSLSLNIFNLFKSKFQQPPLDWNGENWPKYYSNDDSLLWLMDSNDKKVFIPQSVFISPWDAINLFDEIKIELHELDFKPPYKNDDCLDFYIGKNDYNEINARLLEYRKDDKVFVFQGAQYFDWVMTNLSMDFDRSPLPTLREETSNGQKLQSLGHSQLANITGINSLVFSNDGYMIYQKRSKNVLVRPNQLCSGFSGTIDKIDIQHVCRLENPMLSNLDSAREGVEELGISRDNIAEVVFLGGSRELIRGGTPELFYAIDLDLTHKEILNLTPKDKEGVIKSVNFGMYAKSINIDPVNSMSTTTLWSLMKKIEAESNAPISVPFLTNLALWYWHWEHEKVGIGAAQ